MDTSDKYIKMCRKATKIQEQKPDGEDSKSYFYCTEHKCLMEYNSELDYQWCGGWGNWHDTHNEKVIWLPLQDQLYKLHSLYGTEPGAAYLICRTFGVWLNSFGAYIDAQNIEDQRFDSIEQLLLAFVMEDINKRWDGSDWVVQ